MVGGVAMVGVIAPPVHALEPRGAPLFGAQIAAQGLVDALRSAGDSVTIQWYGQKGGLPDLSVWAGGGAVVRDVAELVAPDPDMRCLLDTRGVEELGQTAWLAAAADLRVPLVANVWTTSYPHGFASLLLALHGGWLTEGDTLVSSSRAQETVLRRFFASCEADQCVGPFPGLRTVPIGVDCDRFRPRPVEMARALLDLPIDGVAVGVFGRMSWYDKSDLLPLLVAFRDMTHNWRGPGELRWIIAGDDRMRYGPWIEMAARELGIRQSVVVRPSVSKAEMALYYNACDVAVCWSDSIQESFGQVVIEAMASGLPVVAPGWDGFLDTVDDGATGFLVPVRSIPLSKALDVASIIGDWRGVHFEVATHVGFDFEVFRDRMTRLVESDDLRRRLGAAARYQAEERFAWHVVGRQYVDLLRDASQRPMRRRRSATGIRYGEWFSGYAPRAFARCIVVAGAPLPPDLPALVRLSSGMGRAIDIDQVRMIARAARRGTDVDELVRRVGAAERAGRAIIGWMLKMGFLAVCGEAVREQGVHNV